MFASSRLRNVVAAKNDNGSLNVAPFLAAPKPHAKPERARSVMRDATQIFRRQLKRVASKFGIEVMTRRGLRNLEHAHLSAIEEYLKLLTRLRQIDLHKDRQRVPLLAKLQGANIGEGAHIVAGLASVLNLPGDVCEFGVGTGATSALLANEIRGAGKMLWLYDTFAGLPAPTEEDELIDDLDQLGSMSAYQGRMSHAEIEVLGRLRAISIGPENVRIVKGLFDQTIAENKLPTSVCFAYVDFDFYAPIQAALDKVLPRLCVGGMIIIDDYGFFSSGAQKAVGEFLRAHRGVFEVEIPDYCSDKFAILRRK